MKAPRSLKVSDHALVRFLERAGGLDVEGLRRHMAGSLQRAHAAAGKIGQSDYIVKVDGLEWRVANNVLATVVPEKE